MAPKTQCNAQKLAQILTWIQKSRTVFGIKELEKDVPKVAGISSMQVKDYVQALQDDNKISCEKVGAGNWYFSFPSQAKREADASLQTAQADHDKLDVVVRELRHKLAEKAAQLEQEEAAAMGDGSGQDGREEVMHSKMVLEAEVQTLRTELAAHSDSDPAEFQRRDAECQQFLQDVEQYTDQILELESWIKNAASEDALACCQVGFYGEEWNADEYELRELVSLA